MKVICLFVVESTSTAAVHKSCASCQVIVG